MANPCGVDAVTSAPYQFVIREQSYIDKKRFKGGVCLEDRNASKSPILEWYVNHVVVTVAFSTQEGVNVREQIRDILTQAYEERLQNEMKKQGKFQ